MNYRLFWLAVLLATLNLPALLWSGPNPGDPAPNFTIPDTAGTPRSLSEWHGKVVQLFFWSST